MCTVAHFEYGHYQSTPWAIEKEEGRDLRLFAPAVVGSWQTQDPVSTMQKTGLTYGAVNNHFPVYLAIFGMVTTNNRPNNQVILVQVCSWPVRRQSFAMCGSFAELSNIFILPLYQSWAIISFSVVAKLFNLFSKTLTTTSNQNHDSWHFRALSSIAPIKIITTATRPRAGEMRKKTT